MELTIRPEDLRPGVTIVDVLALLNAGADAAGAAEAGPGPADPDSTTDSPLEAVQEPPTATEGPRSEPGGMIGKPQPPIELPGQLALPLMMAAGVSTPPAATV